LIRPRRRRPPPRLPFARRPIFLADQMLITKRGVVKSDLLNKGIATEAVYDEAGRYRYYLCWRWSDAPALYFWLLNPSKAGHESSDPTLGGLIARARAWGFGAVVIINLFGFRAKNPEDMKRATNPIGDDNEAVVLATLIKAFDDGSPMICGWGEHGAFAKRCNWAVDLARARGVPLSYLVLNESGQPKHPLYIKHDQRPTLWANPKVL
jgi:hypothetical protein